MISARHFNKQADAHASLPMARNFFGNSFRFKGATDLPMGVLSREVMGEVEDRLRILLDL